MDTTTITLRLPKEVVDMIRKYAKNLIVSPTSVETNRDTSIPISKTLVGNDHPSLNDVVDYVKQRNSSVNPQRFFQYYEKRDWRNKDGTTFDWKQKLAEWETYNLEKSNREQAEAKKPNVDAAAVAAFMAEAKRGVA